MDGWQGVASMGVASSLNHLFLKVAKERRVWRFVVAGNARGETKSIDWRWLRQMQIEQHNTLCWKKMTQDKTDWWPWMLLSRDNVLTAKYSSTEQPYSPQSGSLSVYPIKQPQCSSWFLQQSQAFCSGTVNYQSVRCVKVQSFRRPKQKAQSQCNASAWVHPDGTTVPPSPHCITAIRILHEISKCCSHFVAGSNFTDQWVVFPGAPKNPHACNFTFTRKNQTRFVHFLHLSDLMFLLTLTCVLTHLKQDNGDRIPQRFRKSHLSILTEPKWFFWRFLVTASPRCEWTTPIPIPESKAENAWRELVYSTKCGCMKESGWTDSEVTTSFGVWNVPRHKCVFCFPSPLPHFLPSWQLWHNQPHPMELMSEITTGKLLSLVAKLSFLHCLSEDHLTPTARAVSSTLNIEKDTMGTALFLKSITV